MLMLNDRQIDIVKCLLEKDEFITIESLAALFSVGARTVRYDLSQIKAYLLENSISLISKTNHGIKIIATDEEKNKVRNTLARSKQLNASDRKTAMLLSLLIYDHTTYEELADLCKVSKQTIITDFPEVEQYLADKQITVDKLKGSGISIQGSEIDIRHLFTNIIQGNHVDEWLFEDMLNQICKEPAFSISRQIIDTVEKTKNIRFYEHQSIEVCICYVLERIAKGYKIHEDAFHDRELTKEAESDVKVLEAYPFALEDKIVISNILQNAKRRSMNQHEISEDDAEAKEIADYLAERLQKLHPLDPAEKRRFIKGLTTHLAAAICRTRSGIEVKNELLNQIMISIPLLYEYTKKQLKDCEKTFNIEFGENEIAYISMYVTSAFENSVKVDTQVNVLLVCSFGLATSSILKTRMEQVIPECIILGPMSKHEAETYAENHRVDIIISTNDIDFQTIPVIKVNPLIYPEDMDYIKNRLFQLSYSLMCKSFLTSYSKQAKNERQICIKDLISPDNIEIMDHCDSWEKAIVLAAKPLLKSHDIEQRYVEKMIDAVNRLGTYMVLVPETAFVHAGTEDGIRCNCTSILILKKPLVFGNKNPKTVRFLVILGIKNKEENALLELVYIFENENNRSVLVSEDITKDMIGNLHK